MKINREQYNNIWITSDYHYDHSNILKYCDRPFNSVQEMNQNIIHNHNIYVGKNDLWIHLGDLCFGTNKLEKMEYLSNNLNGDKILIYGNHDRRIMHEEAVSMGYLGIYDYLELHTQIYAEHSLKQLFILFHYPIFQWDKKHHGSIMLHGHAHGSLGMSGISKEFVENNKIMDVGIDTNGLKPYHIDEIYRICRIKGNENYTHHNENTY